MFLPLSESVQNILFPDDELDEEFDDELEELEDELDDELLDDEELELPLLEDDALGMQLGVPLKTFSNVVKLSS